MEIKPKLLHLADDRQIVLAQESGRVVCSNAKCEDENGERPRGRIGKNRLDGPARLTWADGRTACYYGQEAS
ncbi:MULTISPECIES: hypothetical protein [unclassified Nonomuraea]|uniref:hypothetical protein n=1 Tax=unclassified Nonomuraea TaxID=2593643 RepID=UPI0035C11A07